MSADAGGGEPDVEECVPDVPVGRRPAEEERHPYGEERRPADEEGRLADEDRRQVAADSLEPLLDVLAEIALEALADDER